MIDPFQWVDVDLQASDNTGIFFTYVRRQIEY